MALVPLAVCSRAMPPGAGGRLHIMLVIILVIAVLAVIDNLFFANRATRA